MKRILFIYTSYSTFVKTDYEILSSKHVVTRYQFKPVKGLLKTGLQFLKQLIFLTFNIWKFDTVFVWFADYHSFLPVLFAKILKKKSFVVVGGYDVANIPELQYGSLSRPLRKVMTLFTFKNATLNLAVVEALEKKINTICPKANTKTLYTGYRFLDKNNSKFEQNREKMVLTVSITNNYQRIQVKGLDRFRELAEKLPDFQFVIVGAKESSKSFFEPIPKNLILMPPLPQNELVNYYLKSSFYAQFSRSEGLPNALCEAMLYGCIPLGLDVGGIPTAMGNNGFLIETWNPHLISDFITKYHNNYKRETIRKHIIKKFDHEKRKLILLDNILDS